MTSSQERLCAAATVQIVSATEDCNGSHYSFGAYFYFKQKLVQAKTDVLVQSHMIVERAIFLQPGLEQRNLRIRTYSVLHIRLFDTSFPASGFQDRSSLGLGLGPVMFGCQCRLTKPAERLVWRHCSACCAWWCMVTWLCSGSLACGKPHWFLSFKNLFNSKPKLAQQLMCVDLTWLH